MKKEDLIKAWEAFASGNDFRINPDKKHIEMIIKGLSANEEKYGLKLCPCRLRDGSAEKDIELICPCNFKTHDTWQKQGRCWCGLFVKR